MQYMLMIQYGNAPAPVGSAASQKAWAELSPEEQQKIGAAYGALNQAPEFTPGLRLQPAQAATTVRVENGQTVTTSGPFVDENQALGGYFFVEADSLDKAIELAAQVPHAGLGGAVEVRPVAAG